MGTGAILYMEGGAVMKIKVTHGGKDDPTNDNPTNIPNYVMDTMDEVIGYMIEGMYKWNEFCTEHGAAYMLIYPERQSRTVCVYEVEHAMREYRCYSCNRKLWFSSEG